MFDVDTQICNYQDVVTNCDREGRVPECTDELRDNSVCRETEQSESLDLPVSIKLNLIDVKALCLGFLDFLKGGSAVSFYH